MARISIERMQATQYRVTVVERGATTSHVVTVTAQDVARYAPEGTSPEQLLDASFRFLLEREPASSILGAFALPVIERYFPEYPREIRTKLVPPTK